MMEKTQEIWQRFTMFLSEHKYVISMVLAFFKAGLALVILGFFAANFALSLQNQDQITTLQDSQDLSFAAISVTHELAKERGRSNLVVSSNGTVWTELLAEQRNSTDLVISASWGTLNQFTSSKGNSEVQALVRTIVAALNSLPAVRYQIDILNYTSTEVISFYSTLNTNLINVAGNLNRPDSGAVCKAIDAYIAWAHEKDNLGLERARVTAATFRGHFLTGDRDNIVSTFVSQAAFETFYNLSATSDQVQELATIKGESLFMNVTGMYNEIVSHPATTQPFNASLSFGYNTWWDTITDAIDYLKDTVELSLSNNVVSTTNNALSDINTLIIINSFGMALTIVIVLGYIIIILFNAFFALGKYMHQRKTVNDMASEMKSGNDHNWE